MAIEYTGITIGTLTLCQPKREKNGDGKYADVKDAKGRTVYDKYKIQIRESNCMAVFLHIYKQDKPDDPKRPWVHQLQSFIVDEDHLKNVIKKRKEGEVFEYILNGKLRDIRLNIYYKEMQTLAKYMARDGLEVKVYYEKPKAK